MTDFPKICELPRVLKTDGWKWERFSPPNNPSYNFWVGTDSNGLKWLTKLKGGFSGYREIVFASLAQEMGWSCQTSLFAVFDEKSLEQLSIKKENNIHAVHYFMNEHSSKSCTEGCPIRHLGEANRKIEKLNKLQISNIMDWPKSVIAACIFGAGEPSDRFFTDSHKFIIIDSEQMFQSNPGNFNQTSWDTNHENIELQEIKIETCRNIAGLPESIIQRSLEKPNGINFKESWPIKDSLNSTRKCNSTGLV